MRAAVSRFGLGMAGPVLAILLLHAGLPARSWALPGAVVAASKASPSAPPKRNRRQGDGKKEAEPAADRRGPLTEEKLRLLKLASVKYYRNQEFILPGDPFAQADLLLRYALVPLPSGEAELANLIVFIQNEGTVFAEAEGTRKQFLAKLGSAHREAVFASLRQGLLGNDQDLSLDEFRRGPGAAFDRLGDEMRKNEVMRAKAKVWMTVAASSIADNVEAHFAPRLGSRELPPDSGLTIYPQGTDRIGFLAPDGKKAWMVGWFIKVAYQGKQPLTNVMLIAGVKTNGPNTNFTADQQAAITLNQTTGFEDKVPDLKVLFKAQNYYRTMPKRTFVYVPELRPGDVVEMPIGEANMEVARQAEFSLYSDQGRWTGKTLELTELMYRGYAKELPTFVRQGATRAEIIRQLGELDTCDQQTWQKTGKVGSTLPAGVDCWSWGRDPYRPKLFLAFRADRLEHHELVVPPRPKPEVAGTPLKFDGRGIGTVKSTISESDPELRRYHARGKVFTAHLKAGTRYVLTISSTAALPSVQVENAFGDHLSVFSKEKQREVAHGIPQVPSDHVGTAVFTPKEDGEYRLVCTWALRSQTRGPFTLTVQPESTVVRPKPTVAGTPLRFDAAGVATAKSAIAANDPLHPRLGGGFHRHKVFTVKLEAGQRYLLRMSSTVGHPLFELEDQHGEPLNRRSNLSKAPGTAKPGELREAAMTFSPEAEGTYRIICCWAFPQEKPGPFTLTVQRK